MIVTEQFVMINFPKTGSTFASNVIKEIYANRMADRSTIRKGLQKFGIQKRPFIKELILPNIKVKGLEHIQDKHGTYCQIPIEYRDRPVVSIVRNPYDRFLSQYEYKSWTMRQQLEQEIIDKNFPNFPDLTVDEFVLYCELKVKHGRLYGRGAGVKIGNQTAQFLQFFFKDPEKTLNEANDEYLDSERVFEDMAEITFLRQEDLNNELAGFLLNNGFTEAEANYVRSRERLNVTKGKTANRNSLWTPKAYEYVSMHERMIFKILEAKGIHYDPPKNLINKNPTILSPDIS